MNLGASPDRSRTFRLRLVLAMLLAWGLVLADHRLGDVTATVRNQVTSWVIVPLRFVAQLPTAAWTTTSNYFSTREELIAANRTLEEELLRERARLEMMTAVEADNVALRRLVDARLRVDPSATVAEIINTASLPFISRIVVNKGLSDGLRLGNGVFNDEGVIGRLSRVDLDTAQALLLTDKRFWVATRNERNNALVLLQGDGGGRLRMRFVPADADIERGDLLRTAGGSSPFPPGLPVAIVGATWVPAGTPFREGQAQPVASIRQETALLVHHADLADLPESRLPVLPSGAVPANLNPDVLP